MDEEYALRMSDEAKEKRREICKAIREFIEAMDSSGSAEFWLRLPYKQLEFGGIITELSHYAPPLHPADLLIDVGEVKMTVLFSGEVKSATGEAGKIDVTAELRRALAKFVEAYRGVESAAATPALDGAYDLAKDVLEKNEGG